MLNYRPESYVEDAVHQAPVFTQQLRGPPGKVKEGQSMHLDCSVLPTNDPSWELYANFTEFPSKNFAPPPKASRLPLSVALFCFLRLQEWFFCGRPLNTGNNFCHSLQEWSNHGIFAHLLIIGYCIVQDLVAVSPMTWTMSRWTWRMSSRVMPGSTRSRRQTLPGRPSPHARFSASVWNSFWILNSFSIYTMFVYTGRSLNIRTTFNLSQGNVGALMVSQ